MKRIGVVTTSRAEFGILEPVLRRLQEADDFHLSLYVSGMHLSPEFGHTVDAVEAAGFDITERVEMLLSSDTPAGTALSMGLGTIGFAQAFARSRPDLLMVLGDRFEMHAAVTAALPFRLPIAHLHGGESTEGLIDEALRHSVTKMSHLHFPATETYAQRIIRMGEAPWRVCVAGAPALDRLAAFTPLPRNELEDSLNFSLEPPVLLVTYHPVTLRHDDTEQQMAEFLGALDDSGTRLVITYPNADPRGRGVLEHLRRFAGSRSDRVCLTASLGSERYFSLMSIADAMVGNSSSGMIEAASFQLPVVNIGERQRGRVHAENVINIPCRRDAIRQAVDQAIAPDFRRQLSGLKNPYGDGHAGERITATLRRIPFDETLLMKHFYDPNQEDAP